MEKITSVHFRSGELVYQLLLPLSIQYRIINLVVHSVKCNCDENNTTMKFATGSLNSIRWPPNCNYSQFLACTLERNETSKAIPTFLGNGESNEINIEYGQLVKFFQLPDIELVKKDCKTLASSRLYARLQWLVQVLADKFSQL